MQFDRVADEARRQNHWFVIGIVEAEQRQGEYPGGVVIFNRPDVAKQYPHLSHGTTAFVIGQFGRITFATGHYDMDHDEALADFAERAKKGR